jgi:hypothetical protein
MKVPCVVLSEISSEVSGPQDFQIYEELVISDGGEHASRGLEEVIAVMEQSTP